MTLPFGYLEVLIAVAGALLILVGIFFFRDRWNSRATRLRDVLGGSDLQLSKEESDCLAAILLYEETYPSFTEILGLALSRFSLRRLRRRERFRQNLDYLAASACRQERSEHVQAAMCQVIRALLEDPDVEYHCRPRLQQLIDSFLGGLEARRAG